MVSKFNRLFWIYQNSNLAARFGEMKQNAKCYGDSIDFSGTGMHLYYYCSQSIFFSQSNAKTFLSLPET